MKDWQVTVDFDATAAIDEEKAFDLIEELGGLAASAALDPDRMGGSMTVTVTAEDGMDALTRGLDAFNGAEALGETTVRGFDVHDWDEVESRNREPIWPKVVGYAEIAAITGVSRQRAREFRKIDSFPDPVIETAQGPLYDEHAIREWAATRKTTAGRRKALA